MHDAGREARELGLVEVGERASHSKDLVVCPRAQSHLGHRRFQQAHLCGDLAHRTGTVDHFVVDYSIDGGATWGGEVANWLAAGAVTTTLTTVSQDADDSAADVDRARVAARELDGLSTELNRLLGVFTV